MKEPAVSVLVLKNFLFNKTTIVYIAWKNRPALLFSKRSHTKKVGWKLVREKCSTPLRFSRDDGNRCSQVGKVRCLRV